MDTHLEQWRKAGGVSTEAMAAALGMQRGSLYRILRATQFPRPETIARIADYTGGAVDANVLVADWLRVNADPADNDLEDMLS